MLWNAVLYCKCDLMCDFTVLSMVCIVCMDLFVVIRALLVTQHKRKVEIVVFSAWTSYNGIRTVFGV